MPRKSQKVPEPVPAPRLQVVRTSNAEDQFNHRADFRSCPHCDHSMDSDAWDDAAVTLVLEPTQYKAGYVSILSECPSCFLQSWVHCGMSCFSSGPWAPEWIAAVEARELEVRLKALRDWGAGLCHRCKHLATGTVEYHAWRGCIRGTGEPQTVCEKFEPELKGGANEG